MVDRAFYLIASFLLAMIIGGQWYEVVTIHRSTRSVIWQSFFTLLVGYLLISGWVGLKH